MLPIHLIPRLSPHAAKLYLVIATLPHRPFNGRPDAPLPELCQLTRLSRRACFRALGELRALRLAHMLPRDQRQPATYTLTASPSTHPMPDVTPQPSLRMPHQAQRTPTTLITTPDSPIVPDQAQQLTNPILAVPHQAQRTPATLISTPKPLIVPDQAQQLTHPHLAVPHQAPPTPATPDSPANLFASFGDIENDPDAAEAFVRAFYPLLSPDQKSLLLATAQATLARLDAQDALAAQEATP